MENFPVINLENINGEERKTILDQIQDACQNWGFFEMRTEMKKLDKDVSLSVIAMKTPGFSGEDPSLISKNQLLARIVGGLGERAEEEVIFSETEITTGVAMDLQQITQIARQMVTKFGMSKIGPWALTDPAVQGHHVVLRMLARN
ncbi:ATP-dependent zinc metalloprotease FTSH 6, chloroplastic [Glycine soja]|uniref:ATP-dependent zinc metalloprotease FTSH 6, chloroplastic n=1 Tax=Glycine soja TaxID=3848 RepID=A0A0B2PCQ7_GLYSO|nr:ATP-dependent zinc metalloprotease FTSH 6, chloroplastic [Glycine soja]